MTMDAVVLAAGRGTRLASTHLLPKGFLKVGALPIVLESIQTLFSFGIRKVYLVTGHLAEQYDRLASGMNGVSTIFNPKYASAGNLHTLYCAIPEVEGDILLLESDLIYEPRALDVLLSHDAPNATLVSGPTGHGDEVYVQTHEGCLKNLGKSPSLRATSAGEFVGISKLSRDFLRHMLTAIAPEQAVTSLLSYEDGLVASGAEIPIACPVVEDLIWCEIDDPSQCAIAVENIYPRLEAARRKRASGAPG